MKYNGNSGVIKLAHPYSQVVVTGTETDADTSYTYNGVLFQGLIVESSLERDKEIWTLSTDEGAVYWTAANIDGRVPTTGWSLSNIGNPAPTVAYVPAALGEARSYTLSTTAEVIEAVTLGQPWKQQVAALKGWELQTEAYFDPADAVQSGLIEGAIIEVLLYPSANVSGRETFEGTGHITAVSIPVEANGLVLYTLTIVGIDELERSTV